MSESNQRKKQKSKEGLLNPDDYLDISQYDLDKLLAGLIREALSDIAKYIEGDSASVVSLYDFNTAKKLIFSSDLDAWCVAFNRDLDTELIRLLCKRIMNDIGYRKKYLSRVRGCLVEDSLESTVNNFTNESSDCDFASIISRLLKSDYCGGETTGYFNPPFSPNATPNYEKLSARRAGWHKRFNSKAGKNGNKNRGNNQVVQTDGVSGEGDKELPMGDEDSCSEL